MKVKDFLEQIALGELSGSHLIDVDNYKLDEKHLPKVLHFLNQGLEYFYSNFPLRTNEVIIKLTNGITRYYLDSDYALSNVDSKFTKFIMDTPDRPFINDVLHITEVISTSGVMFTINDYYSDINVNIPEYNCVEVTNFHQQKYLLIKYLANHPKIELTESYESNVKIHIPSSFETALQTYVACLVYNSMGGKHLNESNALFAKFKSLTEELKLTGIGTLTQTGVNIKPQLRGWI